MGEMNIEIRRIFEATTNWADDIAELAKQIARKDVAFNREALAHVIARDCLLAALRGSDEKIIGMALLAAVQAPTGCCGFVTDFAVLQFCAGLGVEDRLIAALVEEASRDKMKSLVYDGCRATKEIREALSRACFTRIPDSLFHLVIRG